MFCKKHVVDVNSLRLPVYQFNAVIDRNERHIVELLVQNDSSLCILVV